MNDADDDVNIASSHCQENSFIKSSSFSFYLFFVPSSPSLFHLLRYRNGVRVGKYKYNDEKRLRFVDEKKRPKIHTIVTDVQLRSSSETISCE